MCVYIYVIQLCSVRVYITWNRNCNKTVEYTCDKNYWFNS